MSIFSPPFGGGRTYGGTTLKGSLDATLAANLPTTPTEGDMYVIDTAGTFQNDADIDPVGTPFTVGDYIVYNIDGKWRKVEGDAVNGPASSTDNAVVRFDSTTGKLLQNSAVIIDDNDNVSVPTDGSVTIADSASNPPLNLTERNTAPSAPGAGDIYLDDGSNTATGAIGFRHYTGAAWEDISGGGGGLVTSVFTRAGAVVAVANDYTWAQIDKTVSSIADITTRSLTDIDGGNWVVPYTDGSGDVTELALGAKDAPILSGGAAAAPVFGGMLIGPAVVTAAGATPVDTDVSGWSNNTIGIVVGTGGRVFFTFKNATDVYYTEATGI